MTRLKMKSLGGALAASALCLAAGSAQAAPLTNFEEDVNAPIDAGLAYARTQNWFSQMASGSYGPGNGLVLLALLEKSGNAGYAGLDAFLNPRRPPSRWEPFTLKALWKIARYGKDEPKVLMAKHGKFFAQESGDVGLYLTDGYINIMRGTMTTELYFEKYNMILSLEGASAAPKKIEFTPSQLLAQSKTAETYKRKVAFSLELPRRFSLPAVCLVLAFLGPPLALASGKSGKLGGLALGLFVFTLYNTVLIYGESMVNAGKMPHYLGAWLATTLMGIFSWIMFPMIS